MLKSSEAGPLSGYFLPLICDPKGRVLGRWEPYLGRSEAVDFIDGHCNSTREASGISSLLMSRRKGIRFRFITKLSIEKRP